MSTTRMRKRRMMKAMRRRPKSVACRSVRISVTLASVVAVVKGFSLDDVVTVGAIPQPAHVAVTRGTARIGAVAAPVAAVEHQRGHARKPRRKQFVSVPGQKSIAAAIVKAVIFLDRFYWHAGAGARF